MTKLESQLAQIHVALTSPTRQQVLQLMMTKSLLEANASVVAFHLPSFSEQGCSQEFLRIIRNLEVAGLKRTSLIICYETLQYAVICYKPGK